MILTLDHPGRLAPGDCQEWRYGGLSAQACFPWAQLKLLLRRHKYHFGYLDIIRVYFRDPAQEGINDDYRCHVTRGFKYMSKKKEVR